MCLIPAAARVPYNLVITRRLWVLLLTRCQRAVGAPYFDIRTFSARRIVVFTNWYLTETVTFQIGSFGCTIFEVENIHVADIWMARPLEASVFSAAS